MIRRTFSFFLAWLSMCIHGGLFSTPPEFSRISPKKWGSTQAFLERNFPKIVRGKKTFFSKRATKLPFVLEVLPKNHLVFIHLKGEKNAFLGYGHHKIVSKSIAYGTGFSSPTVVARCESDESVFDEISVLKKLKGLRGVVQMHGVIRRSHKTADLFLDYYNYGSLNSIERGALTLLPDECLHVMYDVLKGLQGIHDAGYIHRDLHRGNILLHKEDGKIQAAITDFGKAFPIHRHRSERPSVPRSCCPPEVLHTSFRHIDRKKSEAYAIGVAFYIMVKQARPSWAEVFDHYRISGYSSREKKKRYKLFVSRYMKEAKKIQFLQPGILKDTLTIAFQLMNPNPKKRLSVRAALKKAEQLFIKWDIEPVL